jgi:hypothetical protein
VYIKRMIVSSISKKFRKIDMRKIEWKIQSDKRHDVDKRYRFQDPKDVLDFTSHKCSIFLITWMFYISHDDI